MSRKIIFFIIILFAQHSRSILFTQNNNLCPQRIILFAQGNNLCAKDLKKYHLSGLQGLRTKMCEATTGFADVS